MRVPEIAVMQVTVGWAVLVVLVVSALLTNSVVTRCSFCRAWW
jgi:hypothetical protein